MTTMGLNSVVVTNEANCAERKVTELNILYYGQPMGQGELVEKTLNNIKSLEPNTKKYHAMKFACKRQMTKFLLLPVFAFSITSHATSWVRISEDNIQTLYVDTDRMVKREKR